MEREESRFHDFIWPVRGAVESCQQESWRYDYTVDFDVKNCFDVVAWMLVVKAMDAGTDRRWVLRSNGGWPHRSGIR